jgi:hypothetical protein
MRVQAGDILQVGGFELELTAKSVDGVAAYEALSADDRERVRAEMARTLNILAAALEGIKAAV